ncbi:MAG: hypothetical protein H7315_13110 [Herminiimonas sp.]|nr:hypothetical protein [Herminiimonas sp.]
MKQVIRTLSDQNDLDAIEAQIAKDRHWAGAALRLDIDDQVTALAEMDVMSNKSHD